MTLLIASLAALFIGPLFAWRLGKNRAITQGLDAFVLVSILAIVVGEVIPSAVEQAGALAIGVMLLGLLLPVVVERGWRALAGRAHGAVIVLAFFGLGIHALTDGAALAAPHSNLGIGVVLHRIPMGMLVWLSLAQRRTTGIAVLLVIAGSTVLGYEMGQEMLISLNFEALSLVQALVAGSLLHVVLHSGLEHDHAHHDHAHHDHAHHDHAHHHEHHQPTALPRWNAAWPEALGAIGGASLLLEVVGGHGDAHIVHGHIEFIDFARDSAPILLLVFIIAALLTARWNRARWIKRWTIPAITVAIAISLSLGATIAFLLTGPVIHMRLPKRQILAGTVVFSGLSIVFGQLIDLLFGPSTPVPNFGWASLILLIFLITSALFRQGPRALLAQALGNNSI